MRTKNLSKTRFLRWHGGCNAQPPRVRWTYRRGDLASMENALLVGLTAQLALRRSMEIVANNVANISTGGYKRENPIFEQVLAQVDAPDRLEGTAEVAFVRDYRVLRDLSAGPLEQTGAPLDVAIGGAGHFVIETPNGERFTRDGHFKIDSAGRVVTRDGLGVMGEAGPLSLPANATDIKISEDGTVSANGTVAGRLRVVTFANEQTMIKEGANLLRSDEAPAPAAAPRLAQGMLERSNVQGVAEITRMIEISRAYQAVSEQVNQSEETLKRAVQKLGEVRS
ncbi:MAG TPA: flagellar basal-body rod protein FlgF [Alphaproteobacteria bacterium]|nr:flagellar basal-body rod protein FlgF [Alphaproteobacteria bacterium]HAJ48584.1 flagellar basal-body rod protein FlgF [Alphaproteobacteria bacterium]